MSINYEKLLEIANERDDENENLIKKQNAKILFYKILSFVAVGYIIYLMAN